MNGYERYLRDEKRKAKDKANALTTKEMVSLAQRSGPNRAFATCGDCERWRGHSAEAKSWTDKRWCGECGRRMRVVRHFGTNPYHGDAAAYEASSGVFYWKGIGWCVDQSVTIVGD